MIGERDYKPATECDHERLVARLRGMTQQEALALAVEAGICDENGQLTDRYREDDSQPQDPEHIKSFAIELLVTTRAKSANEAEAAVRDRLREVTEFVGVKSATELVPFTARVGKDAP
ncbi:MAG: hypothetical protein IPP12_22405 [Nitrospira sp.]|nr:hypothetical protein [Nitrospira sp.]